METYQYVSRKNLEMLTILAWARSSLRTLNACRTQRPAAMAFVVAIAGMILPAISERSVRNRIGESIQNKGQLLTFGVKLGFRVDAENGRPQIGSRCDEIQCIDIIFIEQQNGFYFIL